MKYGFLQFAPRRLASEENRNKMVGMLEGVEDALVVAPELALSGYLFNDAEELAGCAFPASDVFFEPILDVLARNRSYLAFGFAEKDGPLCYNSMMLAGPEGVEAVYRKIHLFHREKLVFSPGDAPPPVIEAGGARLGMMICYDWFFPEVARYLYRRGAQVVLHPANLVLPWCLDAMITRSLENRFFTITSNRTGVEEIPGTRLDFYGRSQVVGPDGKRLLQAGAEDEGIFLADFDPAEADRKAITDLSPGPSEVRLDLLS